MLIKIKYGKIILVVWCLMSGKLVSQTIKATVNLLRIDFTKPTTDLKNTLLDSLNIDCIKDKSVSRVIYDGGKTYLLINSFFDDPQSPRIYYNLFNIENGTTRLLSEDYPLLDPFEPYCLFWGPNVMKTPTGKWIFIGRRNDAVFLSGDSLNTFKVDKKNSLIHCAGRINGKYLVSMGGKSSYEIKHYLTDLSTSPNIELSDEVEIIDAQRLGVFSRPLCVYNIDDSLYLYKEDESNLLYLTEFTDNKLKYIKRIRPEPSPYLTFPNLTNWKYCNKSLFHIENRDVVKEDFNSDSLDFVNPEIFVKDYGSTCNFSGDDKFFANIKNDSLLVYSLEELKLINTYSLSSIEYHNSILIDSPYVYLHQIQTETGIDDNQIIPGKFTLSQNYPNPFNPTTTIKYTVPVETLRAPSLQRVYLKVFDVLGREVSTLVDEDKASGSYEATFNGTGFSSGIYFYKLKANNYLEVKKMLLLK